MSSKVGSIDDPQDDIEAQLAELMDEVAVQNNSGADEHADKEEEQMEERTDKIDDKGEGAAEALVAADSNNKAFESVEVACEDTDPKEIVAEDCPKDTEEASPLKPEPKEPKSRRQGLVAKPKKAPASAVLTKLQADAKAASSAAQAAQQQSAAPAAGRRNKIFARTAAASSEGSREASDAPPPSAKGKPSKISKPKVSAADIASAITEGSKQPAADKKRAKKTDKPDKADAKPSKPRSKNAFQFFSAEKRTAIKEEEGITGMGQIAKRLGELWNKLSDEDKKPYQDMAANEKQHMQSKEPDSSSTKASAVKAVKQPQSKTAYLRFCDAFRKEIKDANPNASSIEVTQLLAAAWKDASEEEKAPFLTAQKEEKETLDLAKAKAPTRGRPRKRTITADLEPEDSHPQPTKHQESDNDDEAEREGLDWTEHPAEAILGSTLHHKLIVKRKGLPLTDYGLAKRSRLEDADSPVTPAMLTEYEAWVSNFKKSVAENTHKGVLDLDDLPKDSPLEACYYLGKMVEVNYMLSKAEKGKDTMVRMPVLGLSMCVQRLLDLERQKISELAKKLQAAENQIKQMASATAAEE